MKLIETESDYFHDDQEIITLEKCFCGGKLCRREISQINKYLLQSRTFFIDKNFVRAMEMKKLAFDETFKFAHNSCLNCSQTIRMYIFNSAKDLLAELKKMTKGWFRKKTYIAQLGEVNEIVDEMAASIKQAGNGTDGLIS